MGEDFGEPPPVFSLANGILGTALSLKHARSRLRDWLRVTPNAPASNPLTHLAPDAGQIPARA